jgi:photosystem II stability/assembly factor-like uncharacterized protein
MTQQSKFSSRSTSSNRAFGRRIAKPIRCLVALFAVAQFPASPAHAQQSASNIDPNLYSAMRWRLIGPHRAGRVTAVAGIPGNPAIYYMGTPGGGVWKTTDGGDVWQPIFDDQRVASIGAVAIAPSNPNVLYVGTGEQTRGNGIYKSTDAGATWTHVGLEKTNYITSILIDPRNPDIVLVGALGYPILGFVTEPAERGIYRTTNGGQTWQRVLVKEELDGVTDMSADPDNPREIFAAMLHPPDPLAPAAGKDKPNSWIYKSQDGGVTWHQVAGKGLPSEAMGRIGVAVAPTMRGRRVFAINEAGLFRSDDAGDSWRKITTDPRITGNNYICHVYVDPRNPDIVHVMQTTTYRSTNGGQTFAAFKGAPGGDDYHVLWIDPQNTQRMILGVDQGATISLDAGRTWSTWYNQPTGQFYHVITDNQFPYIAYAPQQDSGTAAVPSRSDFGEITERDWFSIGGFEFCYIAPDPLHPNLVYSGGWYSSVVRFDRNNNSISHVFVPGPQDRTAQQPPIVFSLQDPRKLYLGTQYVLQSTNGGDSWQRISPDLTVRSDASTPAATVKPGGHVLENEEVGEIADAEGAEAHRRSEDNSDEDEEADAATAQTPRRRMSLTALAPSPISADVLWAGSGDGLVQLTTDGGNSWRNVSPPELKPDTFVSIIEPSHFDAATAYVTAINLRDPAPYLYRTRDAGNSWQKIIAGLEPNWVTRVVREDPRRKGLLYAGTQNAVYVSFDDGDHWQSLQLNLPVSDMRDLAVHENDLVVATYGRALWVLDDLSPLRQVSTQNAASTAYLLQPATAVRVRWDNNQETPLPPEIPSAPNPPDGALFYYYLKSAPAAAITLEILDAHGRAVRHFSSDTPPPDTTLKNAPDYWFPELAGIPKNAGLNRFAWDLHYDAPPTLQYSYYGNALAYVEYTISDHAITGNTPREQTQGPIAAPGEYQVVLTVDGQKYAQPFLLTLDPRLRASQADMELQFTTAERVSAGLRNSYTAFNELLPLQKEIAERRRSRKGSVAAPDKDARKDSARDADMDAKKDDKKEAQDPATEALTEFETHLESIANGTTTAPGIGPAHRDLARMYFMIEAGDGAPSTSALSSIADSCSALTQKISDWHTLQSTGLPALNAILQKYNQPVLPQAPVSSVKSTIDACQP